MKVIKYVVLITISLGVFIWFGVKESLQPFQRENINQPIYTIGDINYQKALIRGKNIVKLGPLFFGIYPGGLAFKSKEEARNFVLGNEELLNQFSSGWAIYQLSGDFYKDSVSNNGQRYINKSLSIIKMADLKE
ncbi:MAG: hypothetical protein OIF32_12190 [Campylobacterales bacterium]|nr:hypothetical protein [Campylobacterales bacterium]